MVAELAKQKRIAQLHRELQFLWRPEDRLLTYVQTRLVELAHLGAEPARPVPTAPTTKSVPAADETNVPCAWHADVEGEPA